MSWIERLRGKPTIVNNKECVGIRVAEAEAEAEAEAGRGSGGSGKKFTASRYL